MAIFAIIKQAGPGGDALPFLIAAAYPQATIDLGNGVWLVADSASAVDVSNRIGITPEHKAGSAIVLEVASYYGRANPAIWSWIKEKWEGAPIG